MSDVRELTAADILAVDDRKIVPIDVPEWGGRVHVRTISGVERDAYEDSLWQLRGKNRVFTQRNIRAKLVAVAACDKNGNRLFSDTQVEQLGLKNSAALDRLFDAAQRLNKITDKDIEELVKNSESAQSDDSGTS